MLFRYRIGATSKLAAWRNIGSCFHFVLWQVSSLATYSKLNLKFEVWKLLLIRCSFNVKLAWRSNVDIPFRLKWHYCHIGFVDIQHNFEITYFHFNYPGCSVGILPRRKHLWVKTTDLFSNGKKNSSFFNFGNPSFILCFCNLNF